VLAEGGVCAIDADGIGSSTYFLAKAVHKERVQIYQGSSPSAWHDKARVLSFRNTRAAAYWSLRQALDPSSGLDLALPPDRELRAELCAPTWHPLPGGAVQLEAKDDIKARLGRSPDKADAVVMAWWDDGGVALRQAYREKPKPRDEKADYIALARSRGYMSRANGTHR